MREFNDGEMFCPDCGSQLDDNGHCGNCQDQAEGNFFSLDRRDNEDFDEDFDDDYEEDEEME